MSAAADVMPVALTVAGSDSGGGAGVQADLRVFARIGVFGTTALTAVTAQNLAGVRAVVGLDPAAVQAQVEAVLEGFAVRAVKTGMLWSRSTVEAVAELIAGRGLPLVVDPVMVATSGARLLDEAAVEAYRRALLPVATLVTPNLDEAAVLLGAPVDESVGEPVGEPVGAPGMRAAADRLYERLGCPVLLKGGHLDGDPVDVLRHGGGSCVWRHPRISSIHTHGSGCMLSAAIAARLALGDPLERACEQGLGFVHQALASGHTLADGVRLAGIERANCTADVLERLE